MTNTITTPSDESIINDDRIIAATIFDDVDDTEADAEAVDTEALTDAYMKCYDRFLETTGDMLRHEEYRTIVNANSRELNLRLNAAQRKNLQQLVLRKRLRWCISRSRSADRALLKAIALKAAKE